MDDRTCVSWCLLVFTLARLALPLRYHLCPVHDPTDERFAWRMFSQQMWSHRTLVLYWQRARTTTSGRGDRMIDVFAAAAHACHKRVCAVRVHVALEDHFTRAWVDSLAFGPRPTLVRACEYLCTRIPAAARVRYEWTLDEWRHRGWPRHRRTLRGGATCTRANSTCVL